MFLKMALRNVLRQRRRSLLTALMMFFSFVLLSFTIAFESGTYDQIISMFTKQYVGHVQIHSQEFVKSPSIYETINTPDEVLKNLSTNPMVRAYSPRIIGGALASVKNKTFGTELFGIDPQKEENTTHISSRIASGRMPQRDERNEVLIGGKLAQILKVNINDELILISSGADGSIANDLFKVVGIFDAKAESKDDYRVYMTLESAYEFFSLSASFHEVAINLKTMSSIEKFTKQFDVGKNNISRSWMVIEKDFYKAMVADKKGSDISFFIIMLIVGMGVLNTVLMATLERSREFGVLKVIGTTPSDIIFLVILETLMISAFSIAIGTIAATLINYYFQVNGISLGESFSYGGITFDVMYAEISFKSYWIPSLIIVFTSIIVSLYPGYKAAKTSAVDAMREF